MSIIENKIAFPTQFGKLAGFILIFLFPYFMKHEILSSDFSWLSPWLYGLSLIIAIIYVYFWIRADKKNSPEDRYFKILEERNEIEKGKVYYNTRR